VLKYDENTIRDATNIDVLLGALTLLPICIGFILESPLADYIGSEEELLQKVLRFWWRVRRYVKTAGVVSSTPRAPAPAPNAAAAVSAALEELPEIVMEFAPPPSPDGERDVTVSVTSRSPSELPEIVMEFAPRPSPDGERER
jgi:hypothetical protein